MVNIQSKNIGNVSVLNLDGNVVVGETETLHDVVQALPSTDSVVLDLSGVSMVDAHGLGMLLQLREQAQARNMRFELMNVSSQLRELFRITRLDTVFQIRPGFGFFLLPAPARRPRVAA
jgi:anti-sigma B factor antagonist